MKLFFLLVLTLGTSAAWGARYRCYCSMDEDYSDVATEDACGILTGKMVNDAHGDECQLYSLVPRKNSFIKKCKKHWDANVGYCYKVDSDGLPQEYP
ncbi:hypothetical protein LZ30DRAFT_739946 [Colletotrichum cereale]|nr:hypothetical protein LZ30DRAFT_739946 [Colletotrichum cereale]